MPGGPNAHCQGHPMYSCSAYPERLGQSSVIPCCRANLSPSEELCCHPFAFARSPALPGLPTLGYSWSSGHASLDVEVWCTANSVSLVIVPIGYKRDMGWSSFVFTLESSAFEGLNIQETGDMFMDVTTPPEESSDGAVGTLSGSTLTISTPTVSSVPAGQVFVVATYRLVRLPTCRTKPKHHKPTFFSLFLFSLHYRVL